MYVSVRPDNDLVVALQLNIDDFRSLLEGMLLLNVSPKCDCHDLYIYENLRKVACELQELDLW